jgi:hypothetical protein
MRLGHCARQFKSRNCLLAGDRGKALEKLVERIPGFEIVVQRLDGYPGPDKNRSAAENLRVAVHDWGFVGHGYRNLPQSIAPAFFRVLFRAETIRSSLAVIEPVLCPEFVTTGFGTP